MLKIRLQRTGRINQPSYRIIVTEHARAAKTGAFLEELGTYNPSTKAHTLKEDRTKYWLSVGAKASPTMHNMLLRLGVVTGKKINVLPKKSPPKSAEGGSASGGKEGEPSSAEASQGKETSATTPSEKVETSAEPVEVANS